jgi:hypothetical protein
MKYAAYAVIMLLFSWPAVGPVAWGPGDQPPALAESWRADREEALESARGARARVDEWGPAVRTMAGASLTGEPDPGPSEPDPSNAALAAYRRVERFRALLDRWVEAERAPTAAHRTQRLKELRRDLNALPPSRGSEVDWLDDQLEKQAEPGREGVGESRGESFPPPRP